MIAATDVINRYLSGYDFNSQIKLYDTVKVNEDFFIGNQWEGVQANGLPTPTFNFLKQVVNFQVATITSDNFTLQASPLPSVVPVPVKQLERICHVINSQYAAIIERNHIVKKMREFMRNAAVDGDGCMYFRFDPAIKNGQEVSGEIVAEVVENTRVIFGNPNRKEVQKQPYIIISRREIVSDVRRKAKDYKEDKASEIADPESIQPDSEVFANQMDSYTDDKVTVLMYFWRNHETDTIWYAEAINDGFLRNPVDTGFRLYPLVWLNWDSRQDCYHGQAMITGLLPNQKFVNKMFAMVGISLMTSAFPKIVYDRTKVKKWDGGVGSAVGVSGNVEGVAKTIQGAAVNPQIADFISMAVDMTKSMLGASNVALGDSRPDNTSAIVALQRAANTPMEMTRQSMYECVEEMGMIWQDIMSVCYGKRQVEVPMDMDKPGEQPLGMEMPEQDFLEEFDFSCLRDLPVAIKQDAGASSYWSEIASVQTLDNLLMNHLISVTQYLERMPAGYVKDKQKLIDELRGSTSAAGLGTGMAPETAEQLPIPVGSGNGALQRAIAKGA